MAIKLLINPAAEARACIHPETGVEFMIRPISPEKYAAVRKASLDRHGDLDMPKFGENMADAAIANWDDQIGDTNGPMECNEKNKRLFGRNHALNIMPWITDQATSLDQYRLDEEQAAKNA
jgi:hypothetical protein